MARNSPAKTKFPYDEGNSKSPKKMKTALSELSVSIDCERTGSHENDKSEGKINETANTASEERYFYNLFQNILDFLLKRENIQENEMTDAIGRIVTSFKYDLGNNFSDIDLSEMDNLCGYLFRYVPHGAGLARNRVLNAINNCEGLKVKLTESELNVVSLGGGPGNDMIGFSSALCELSCLTKSRLNFTVVDSVREWSTCVLLAEFLIRSEDFGNVSKLFNKYSVTMSFFDAEVPDESNEDYLRVVREADVIILSKLISIMGARKSNLIQSLFKNMKKEAFLLFIDSPFEPNLWENFSLLYKSECGDYMKSYTEKRFEKYECTTSKAQIAVLQKKCS